MRTAWEEAEIAIEEARLAILVNRCSIISCHFFNGWFPLIKMGTENICDEAKVTNKSHVLLLWSIENSDLANSIILRKPQWHFLKFVQTMTTIMILTNKCLNWNWISCLFLLGDHGADVRVGVVKRSREDRRGGWSLYLYFLVDLFICILFCFLVDLCICICRFPFKTVLSSGGELGSEQEGEERRGGHLPCLPWGPGRGRAGWKWFKLTNINLLPCQVGTVACPCQQPHHRACLTKWLRGHDTCPYCRGSVNTK